MAALGKSGLIAGALLTPLLLLDLPARDMPEATSDITGAARVLDGDTLEIGVIRIRLHGIDAPEYTQTCAASDGGTWPCGRAAADRLKALADGVALSCTPRERDHHGRIVATCYRGGRDLARTLAADGLAWAYRRYSDAYVPDEATARARFIGIWQADAQAAWEYRASDAWQPAVATAPSPDCPIKGNVSQSGERIYHMPGSKWYARTRISEAGGEHWFCNTAEAEAAGWRPASGG